MGDARNKEDLYGAFAEVGKVLSNGKRIEILDVLSQGERSVEVLAERVGTSVTTTSAHLQIMRRSGLVSTRREGTHVYYSLASFDVVKLLETFRSVARMHYERVEPALERYLGRNEAESIDQRDLQSRWSRGHIVILDVRPHEEYLAGHIPGAISIPLERLSDEVEKVFEVEAASPSTLRESEQGNVTSADLEIVVYCRGAYCSFANDALAILQSRNLNTIRLSDGFTEWRIAGREVEV
jgi:rhodanese-related sulfurtransferase